MTDGRPARVLRLLLGHPLAAALRAAAARSVCHLVGGALRDRLLGLPARDVDAVVERDGAEISERLAQSLPARLVHLGRGAFAAWRLVGRDFVLDLWDRQGTPLVADLERRDFTVNSFALDLATGELTDPRQGLADLGRRVLRATTRASFTADPLRVLRLPRLAAQLPGFAADPASVALARAAVPALDGVAAERVREELRLILASEDAPRAIALLATLDLYPGLWLGRPGSAGDASAAVGRLERLEARRRRLRELAQDAPEVDLVAARWAVSFLGLPEGWPAAEPTARRFAAAGYLPRASLERVLRAAGQPFLPVAAAAQRTWLHGLGDLWPTAAVVAGSAAQSDEERARWERGIEQLAGLARDLGAAIFAPPPLLDGDEVQRILGLPPGPAIGQALAALREAQVAGRVEDRDAAERLVRELGSPR